MNILFSNLATISSVPKLPSTHHVQPSEQRQSEGIANDSFCGSYLMTEFEFSCYATDNLKNVTQMTKHHAAPKMLRHLQSCFVHVKDWRVIGRTSNALLLYDVIDFAMLRETTRRTQVFLLHALTFRH